LAFRSLEVWSRWMWPRQRRSACLKPSGNAALAAD